MVRQASARRSRSAAGRGAAGRGSAVPQEHLAAHPAARQDHGRADVASAASSPGRRCGGESVATPDAGRRLRSLQQTPSSGACCCLLALTQVGRCGQCCANVAKSQATTRGCAAAEAGQRRAGGRSRAARSSEIVALADGFRLYQRCARQDPLRARPLVPTMPRACSWSAGVGSRIAARTGRSARRHGARLRGTAAAPARQLPPSPRARRGRPARRSRPARPSRSLSGISSPAVSASTSR